MSLTGDAAPQRPADGPQAARSSAGILAEDGEERLLTPRERPSRPLARTSLLFLRVTRSRGTASMRSRSCTRG